MHQQRVASRWVTAAAAAALHTRLLTYKLSSLGSTNGAKAGRVHQLSITPTPITQTHPGRAICLNARGTSWTTSDNIWTYGD